MNESTTIPGYTYGSPALARSPVSPADFESMKKSVLFGDDDVKYLRLSHDVLEGQVEAVLDVWYGFVASNPHLLASFTGPDGKPVGDYLGGVRKRFGRWILDTARAEYDQSDARGVGQVLPAAGDAVDPPVRQGRRLLTRLAS